MNVQRSRRHLTHFEVAGGTCHITWRLHRRQPLLTPAEREVVLDVLRRGVEYGCVWRAAAVMDDHVHALITPGTGADSARLVRAWKGVSSHQLVKAYGRRAPVWQAEYYQRWIWTSSGIAACARYIRANPERRWPGIGTYRWVL